MKFKSKRPIKLEELERILAAEMFQEGRTPYQLCCRLGASQSGIANLKGEDADWKNNTVGFTC